MSRHDQPLRRRSLLATALVSSAIAAAPRFTATAFVPAPRTGNAAPVAPGVDFSLGADDASRTRAVGPRSSVPRASARRASAVPPPENEDEGTTTEKIATNASPPPPPPPTVTASDMMRALGTSPRRIVLSLGGATAVALGANFLGSTSALLGVLPPEAVESSGLDAYYPVNGFKRFSSSEFGYSFAVPNGWAADTAVELAKATRRAARLDYEMPRRNRPAGGGVIPDAAFGPPGKFDSRGVTSNTDTNVSAVTAPATPGFRLASLGGPTEAAETLLRVSLAPEGSGRKATLLGAAEVQAGKARAYRFEYDVDRGEKGVPLRALSNVAVREGDVLITMTVVAPREGWEGEGGKRLRKVAESFRITR